MPEKLKEDFMRSESKSCKNCFVTESFPGVTFNDDGVCCFCQKLSEDTIQDELKAALEIDKLDELRRIAEKIKQEAREDNCKYDCIIGASGGFDSTYVLYVARKLLGLNPLVVKYDNGVCHKMANENLKKACEILGVELRHFDVIEAERKYFKNATKALINLGVFFSACFSCHYIIASVVYREAKKEKIRYMLTSTNKIEKDLADTSHGFMLKSLIRGFLKCNPLRMLKVIYYEIIAFFYFIKLKFEFDKFYPRFFRNLFSLHPVKPSFINKVDISDYVAWNWPKIESILRQELGWQTPRNTKVPYFRFDCHYSAMIDKSFKKITGLSEHALLINWFIQAGFADKKALADDFTYMNDDQRINNEIRIIWDTFDLPEDRMKEIL